MIPTVAYILTFVWHLMWHTFWHTVWILSHIFSDILSDILSDIYSDIFIGILSDIFSGLVFGSVEATEGRREGRKEGRREAGWLKSRDPHLGWRLHGPNAGCQYVPMSDSQGSHTEASPKNTTVTTVWLIWPWSSGCPVFISYSLWIFIPWWPPQGRGETLREAQKLQTVSETHGEIKNLSPVCWSKWGLGKLGPPKTGNFGSWWLMKDSESS